MAQLIYRSTVFPECLTMKSGMRIQVKKTNVVASAQENRDINMYSALVHLKTINLFPLNNNKF